MTDAPLHPEVEKLIAEGPRIVDVHDGIEFQETHQQFARRIALLAAEKAREEERERCAKVCERPYSDAVSALGTDEPMAVGAKCAAAIRRGKP